MLKMEDKFVENHPNIARSFEIQGESTYIEESKKKI